MNTKMRSLVFAEVIKDNKGHVLVSQEYHHIINFIDGRILCEIKEIIRSQKKAIVVKHEKTSRIKGKIIEINLLTGKIIKKGKTT
ncbi:MAG: hypothetical protein NUV91_01565 [Candidatus Omnitrophica bacterium]|nr:hypothetical protein [Candidatus Omnitrophota bacterium]